MHREAYVTVYRQEMNASMKAKEELHTIISSKVSRLTLKGIFLITIAVGIISSSPVTDWVVDVVTGAPGGNCVVAGGDPPPEEISEL